MPSNPIYDFLKANGLTDKDEQTFLNEYSNPDKAKELYGFLQQNNLTDKGFDDFYGTYLKKKEAGHFQGFSFIYNKDVPHGSKSDLVNQQHQEAIQKVKEPQQKLASVQQQEQQNPIDNNDPLGSQFENLNNRQQYLTDIYGRRDATAQRINPMQTIEASNEMFQLNGQKKQIQNYINNGAPVTTTDAKQWLNEQIKKSNPNLPDVDGLSIQEIEKDIPKTATNQAVLKTLEKNRNVFDSFQNSQTIQQAALKWGRTNPKYATDIQSSVGDYNGNPDFVDKGLMRNILIDFLQQPATREWAAQNHQNGQAFKMAYGNLESTYPELKKNRITEAIANYREKSGQNSAWYNAPGKESTDQIVDKLIEQGKLSLNDRKYYEKEIRPQLGFWRGVGRDVGNMIPGVQTLVNNDPIPTTGIENLSQGYKNILHETAKGIEDIGTLGQGVSTEDALQSKYQLRPELKTKSGVHELSKFGWNMMGELIPIITTGTAGKMLGASEKLSTGIGFGISALDNKIKEAKTEFPNDPLKQVGYVGLMTGFNVALGYIIPDGKPTEVAKGLRDDVSHIISNFADGTITREAAIASAKDAFYKVVSEKAPEYLTKIAEHDLKGGTFMTAPILVDHTLKKIFGGQSENEELNANDLIHNFVLGSLASTPLSAMSAHGDMMQKRMLRDEIWDVTERPDYFKSVIDGTTRLNDKADIVDNLNEALKIRKDLESKTELTENQKKDYLLQSLNEKALKKQLDETSDSVLQDKIKERIKESKEVRENILTRREGQLENVAENQKEKLNDNSGIEKEPEVLQPEAVREDNGGSENNIPVSEGTEGQVKDVPETTKQTSLEPFITKNGKYTVSYEEGKRVVKDANGNTPSERVQKKVLAEHAENFNYNNKEEIKSEPPQFSNEQEADRWQVENSTNPSEIADTYLRSQKEVPGLTTQEQAIRNGIDAGILAKVRESDYNHIKGVKAEGQSKAMAWFSNDPKKSSPIDQIAKEISDHTGVDVTPEDITDFIDKFPNGEYQSRGERDTIVHQIAKERFEELTGIPLTDKVARMAAEQYYSADKVAQSTINVDHKIETEPLPEEEISKWLKEIADREENNSETIDNLDNYEQQISENNSGENSTEPKSATSSQQDSTVPQGTGDTGNLQQHDTSRPSEEQQQVPESGTETITYQSGLSIPFANELVEHDVKPFLAGLGKSIRSAVDLVVRTLSPKTGVSEKAITHLMNALGSRNEAEQKLDKAIGAFQKMFDKMKEEDRIGFIDRIKRGEQQLTPELQDIADMIKALDKNLYDEIIKYKPSLTWKENHYRVLWKEIPGSTTGKETFWSNLRRRPFQGSKGFLKQATLLDMSEGIEKGGVPQTTNPIKMFKLAYADAMKYITAQRMFEALKGDKFVRFVKFGDRAPEGFVPIDDRMAKVYYPTPEGMVNKGEWYIEEGAGRLLNNHLSRDYIRENAFGKGLMELKNLYTQVELGLSAFHAIAEGLETISSDIGLGLRKLINLGLRGDFKSAAEGVKDIALSFGSPRSTYIAGRRAIKFASVKDFENSELGKKFLAKFPDAEQYVHDFFNGGGLMKQHDDLRASTFDAMKEHAGKDNYIGAALRAIPAMNEMILNPLFNHYIPALKVGMFFKEFPVTLRENKALLNSGEVTREQLARRTIDFIDDRLGEMNFDNLFWNRTFKTSMQFFMRSVTWKLGNLRGMLGAPIEQAHEFYDAARNKRAPLLMPKMAWLFGLSTMQVVLATVIQKMLTGKSPTTFKDIVAPQINKDDETERVIMPTYYKDMLHLWHSKLGYVTTSMSGNIAKVVDIWNNKDFYGYEIHDEHDSWLQKRKDDLRYFIPKPFSFSSLAQMKERGEPVGKQLMSFFGLNKAPGYLTHTDIENEIFDLYNVRNAGTKPKDAKEANDTKKEIRMLYREGKKDEAQKMADDAVKKGLLRPSQIKFLLSHVTSNENPSVFFFKGLPFEDKKYLYEKMSGDEKSIYDQKGTFKKQVESMNRRK